MALTHAAWEGAVAKHLNATASEGLRTLCSQPFVKATDLEKEAELIGMDTKELHSALRFLHSIGSVLYYGSGTQDLSQKVQETVFMQPQFILDAIKYVIREAMAEDVNDELRALDTQIRNKRDLKQYFESGELTRSLLTEVWGLAKGMDGNPKFKRQDHTLMLELLKGFKLLRVLGAPCDAKLERYVVPAMLPNQALPPKYITPEWWCPEQSANAADMQNDSEPPETALAAMRVVYEVLGGRLPFSFMSELQVSLALENMRDRKHFAPEVSSLLDSVVERVAGSVPSQTYKCDGGNVTEWVVVSQRARSCRVSTAEEDLLQNSLLPGAIRVMAWVDLNRTLQRGATDWRLLKRVMQDIESTERGVPGLSLRQLVVYVNAQGTCSIPQEITGTTMANTFVTFGFDNGSEEVVEQVVEQAMVLPQEEGETLLVQRQRVCARAQSAAQGGVGSAAVGLARAKMTNASATHAEKPCIEGFFCKKDCNKKEILRQIAYFKTSANATENEEKLQQLESLVVDSVESIDVLKEAQELNMLFTHARACFHFHPNPQPTFEHFSDCMMNARERNVRILHLAGHGQSQCGFFWLKNSFTATEYEAIPTDRFTGLIKTEVAGPGGGGTIECVVLNACETEKMGKALRTAGVWHVVCWRSEVEDSTANQFAQNFYKSLDQNKDYKPAFEHAVARTCSGQGGARVPQKHLRTGAVDYVCLLSCDGDVFPNTGCIRDLN